MELLDHLDKVIITIGSFLGAVKASAEFKKDTHIINKLLDVCLGVFVGVVCSYHFGSQYSHWFMGLIALIGGASGALVIEVFLQLLPNTVRKFLKNLAGQLK